jgi:hypothetical protein
MAFFGLTYFGSQSPFELAKETPLHVFETSDFRTAFIKTWCPTFRFHSEDEDERISAQQDAEENSILSYNQLEQMLCFLYKCPKGINNVPKTVMELVHTEFHQYATQPDEQLISLQLFLDHMQHAASFSEAQEAQFETYQKQGIKSREFTSNAEFRAALAKHHRMERNPKDKYLLPVTDSQRIGWNEPTIINKRKPNISCEETRFASAMIKAGVYYY